MILNVFPFKLSAVNEFLECATLTRPLLRTINQTGLIG